MSCGEKGAGWLRDAGAEIVDVTLPHTKYALAAYYIVARPEPPPTWRGMTACASAFACRGKSGPIL